MFPVMISFSSLVGIGSCSTRSAAPNLAILNLGSSIYMNRRLRCAVGEALGSVGSVSDTIGFLEEEIGTEHYEV